MTDKIKFKDLSLFNKIGILGGILTAILFSYGFIQGFITALLA